MKTQKKERILIELPFIRETETLADAPGWRRLQPGLTRNFSGEVVFILKVKILSPTLVKINVWTASWFNADSVRSKINSSCGLKRIRERLILI